MAKRKPTPAEQLREHVDRLTERYAHWEAERKEGCVAPNWSDGVNLNLVRNHIISEKRQICVTCDKFGLIVPAIYFRPLPPVMSADFFATGKNYNPQRIERISNLRDNKEDEQKPMQLSLF